MADMTDTAKDEALMTFLSMTEDRVDPDVAQNLLHVVNWDVQAAIEQLYGGRPETAASIATQVEEGGPASAMEVDPVRVHDEDDEQLQFGLAGSNVTDDDLIQQAIRASQQEEEARQRQELRQQQEMELAESILMDNMRAQQEREGQEAAAVAAKHAEEQRTHALAQEQKQQAELETRRASLPCEPAASEPGRVALVLRLPDGSRLQRSFRGTEAISVVYDFIDVTYDKLSGRGYRLVSTHPRKAYEDRNQTLAEAGIQNQFVLMVEMSQ